MLSSAWILILTMSSSTHILLLNLKKKKKNYTEFDNRNVEFYLKVLDTIFITTMIYVIISDKEKVMSLSAHNNSSITITHIIKL